MDRNKIIRDVIREVQTSRPSYEFPKTKKFNGVVKMEAIQKVVNENPDSIEIGTPSKGGALKVYGNFDNPDAFKAKIENAISVRDYAKSKIEVV